MFEQKTVHQQTPLTRWLSFWLAIDTWFHAPCWLVLTQWTLFYQQTKLSSPSKQGSNWRHQMRQASVYSRHFDVSVTSRLAKIFNQQPYFVETFWTDICSATTSKNHGLCGSNKLLYKRCAKSMGRPKFRPPTAPTFFNHLNKTWNQERYPGYNPTCKIWLMWDDGKWVCVGRAFYVIFLCSICAYLLSFE